MTFASLPEEIQVLICCYLLPEENARIAYVTDIPELGLVNHLLVHTNPSEYRIAKYAAMMAHPIDIGIALYENREAVSVPNGFAIHVDIMINGGMEENFIDKSLYSDIRDARSAYDRDFDKCKVSINHFASSENTRQFVEELESEKSELQTDLAKKRSKLKNFVNSESESDSDSGTDAKTKISKSKKKSKNKPKSKPRRAPDSDSDFDDDRNPDPETELRKEIDKLESKIRKKQLVIEKHKLKLKYMEPDMKSDMKKFVYFCNHDFKVDAVIKKLRNMRIRKMAFECLKNYSMIVEKAPELFAKLEELILPMSSLDVWMPIHIKRLVLHYPALEILLKRKWPKQMNLDQITLIHPKHTELRGLLNIFSAKSVKIELFVPITQIIINLRNMIPEKTESFSLSLIAEQMATPDEFALDLGKVPDSLETLYLSGNITMIGIQPNHIKNLYLYADSECECPDLGMFPELERLHVGNVTEINSEVDEIKIAYHSIHNKKNQLRSKLLFIYERNIDFEHGSAIPIVSGPDTYLYYGKPIAKK